MMFCHRFELAFCDIKKYGMLNEIIVKRTNKQVIYAQHVFEQVRDLCWDKLIVLSSEIDPAEISSFDRSSLNREARKVFRKIARPSSSESP
jgi:ABC-type Na+ transport system ATPase subunit NatA